MQCLPRVSKPEYSGARLRGNAWQRRNIPAPAREGLRPICRGLLSQCTRACANSTSNPSGYALGIWIPVSHAPSCIETTNPSRTGLNPLNRIHVRAVCERSVFKRTLPSQIPYSGWKIEDLNPIWVRLLGRSQLSNPSDLPCYEWKVLHFDLNFTKVCS